ncbi:hypothetical protein BDD26_2321 [Xenorhabdus cabanillasii]|uniref:Beta-ketoacyl synthase N-terminal domain-containing protein n=1 Tax=Xenorhabdus cabanillasii TaxID=351673 RepID=A0A3D9UGM0_9GAMM|nr:hypothetical protein [Xenorhabdus cabanillasii]REF27533.1 hypothetical protein BDD26_2321 [Xenorhabdus cabanillasii]
MEKSRIIKLVSHNITTPCHLFNNLNYEKDDNELIKNKKLRRYYSTGTKKGIISTRKALISACLDVSDPKIRFGLYTTQYGYLHPLPSELLPVHEQTKINNSNSIYQAIWECERVNPFLITLSLSNNLLGVLSQELSLQCDCASFLRGNLGLLSAFSEAELCLNNNLIDYALVVASGIGSVTQNTQSGFSGEFVEFAVTFILTRVENQVPQDNSHIIDITCLHQNYREGNYAAETILFIKDIEEHIKSHRQVETVN